MRIDLSIDFLLVFEQFSLLWSSLGESELTALMQGDWSWMKKSDPIFWTINRYIYLKQIIPFKLIGTICNNSKELIIIY